MTDQNLELAFYGALVDGQELSVVKANIAVLFKASEAQVDRMFSGSRVVIKNRLDAETAKKYVQAMNARGARCKIEVMGSPGVDYRENQSVSSEERPRDISSAPSSGGTPDQEVSSKESKGAVVQVAGERPLVAGAKVDEILGQSSLEVASLGTRMQDAGPEVSGPDLPGLDNLDVLPLGTRMQDESNIPDPIVPDTSHLSIDSSED